jgi:hypothetical protein
MVLFIKIVKYLIHCCVITWAGTALSVQRLATNWDVRESNPAGDEIFRTRPDRPWAPSKLLYNGHGSFQGVKQPGRDVNHLRVNFTVLRDNRIRRLPVSVQFATVSPNLTGHVSPSCPTHCVYKFTTINVFGASTLRSTGSANLAVAYFTLKIHLNSSKCSSYFTEN